METQPAVQPAYRRSDQLQLCKRIKALIAKGDKAAEKSEQFYIAAGLELKRLKDGCRTQTLFLNLIRDVGGVGKSRAYELLQIADGKKTVAEVRADTAKRTADSKARLKASATSGQTEPCDADTEDGTPVYISQPCSPRRQRVFEVEVPDEIEPCEDCDTPEARWQRSLANLAGDAVAMEAYWSKEFGNWEEFLVPSDLYFLTMQALEAWSSIRGRIGMTAVDPEPVVPSVAPPVQEFDAGDIPKS